MNDISTKKEQAIEACKKVLGGIEDGSISVSSSLMLCKQIARLVNDIEGQEWLSYEYGGYPTAPNGAIPSHAWVIAKKHGRSFWEEKNRVSHEYIFTELCGELERKIESLQESIHCFTTQGFSVSSEHASFAITNMTEQISNKINATLNNIRNHERRLSILKAQYYDYASKWLIELSFGNAAQSIFEEYQEKVNILSSTLPITALQKIGVIEELIGDNNPERYAQVLTSCRRLWSETANYLFNEVLPNYQGTTYKSLSGKEIDISGDHDKNKLSAAIEQLQLKAAKNTLVGSEIVYLVDWLDQINKRQSAGVHDNVTREEAVRCIIHTYIALGDILSLRASAEQKKVIGTSTEAPRNEA